MAGGSSSLTGSPGQHAVTESELNDLRRKFQVMERDRKAYYELSMKQMRANKATISSLRTESKGLREEVKSIRKKIHTRDTESQSSAGDIEKLEKNVSLVRRNLDAVKASVEEKRQELSRLRDQARDFQMCEGSGSQRGRVSTTPENASRIRSLENRLDRSMVKYNEASSIRTTYEQIQSRLRDERDGFDAQVTAIEKMLRAKCRDLEELQVLASDALQAKESIMKELNKSRETLDNARKKRAKDLRRQKQIAENSRTLTDSMVHAGKSRAEAFGHPGVTQTVSLSRSAASDMVESAATTSRSAVAKLNKVQNDAQLDKFQAMFSQIAAATGVSDINEVTQKMINQKETVANLEELVDENTSLIEEKAEEVRVLKTRIEQVRFTGVHHTGFGTRKKIDDLEDNLQSARSRMLERKSRFESYSSIIVDAQAGIKHIVDKIKPLRGPNAKHLHLNKDTLGEALGQCESVLVGACETIEAARETHNAKLDAPPSVLVACSSATTLGASGTCNAWQQQDYDNKARIRSSSSSQALGLIVSDADEKQLLQAMPYNQRIRLAPGSTLDGEDVEEKDQDEILSIGSVEDEDLGAGGGGSMSRTNDSSNPISRAQLKEASQLLVRARDPAQTRRVSQTNRAGSKRSSGVSRKSNAGSSSQKKALAERRASGKSINARRSSLMDATKHNY